MMNMTAMLGRGLRNLAAVTRRAPFPHYSSPSFYCFVYSTSMSTPSQPSSGVVSRASASDVADVVEEEADDVLYPHAAASSSVKLAIPTLLQPRVVVYDGVCHLCHRGAQLCFQLFPVLEFLFHLFHALLGSSIFVFGLF